MDLTIILLLTSMSPQRTQVTLVQEIRVHIMDARIIIIMVVFEAKGVLPMVPITLLLAKYAVGLITPLLIVVNVISLIHRHT